jgi:hypothetical protein
VRGSQNAASGRNPNRASEKRAARARARARAVDSLGSTLLSAAVPEKTQACAFWPLRW